MGLRVGTLVTRYDSFEKDKTCQADERPCIGVIQAIEPYEPEPDNPTIVVQWVHSCSYHYNALNVDMRFITDDLWEIGQLN
jgi:hypothetical protein